MGKKSRGSGPKSMVMYSVAIVACMIVLTGGYAVADFALTSTGTYDLPGFFSSVNVPAVAGQEAITDNLNFALTDALARSAVSGASIYILDTSGAVLEGPLTTASNGIIASSNEYRSGTHLIIEVAKTGYVTQFYDYVVPTMSQADLAKNPTTHYTKDLAITNLGAYTITVVDSTGTSYTSGTTQLDWSDAGVSQMAFTVTIYETNTNEGWASSYDPINRQNQNMVAQMSFNSTGHSLASGYDSAYTWGPSKAWFKVLPDSTLCKQVQGSQTLQNGVSSFTIMVNKGSFATGCERLTIDLRDYFDVGIYGQMGDGGVNDASLGTFTIDFVP